MKSMKKKTLRNVILLVCVLAAIAVAIGLFASADEGKVVYVSANGTGDGTSASSPLGNDAGYDALLANEIANMPSKVKSTLYEKSALYKAYQQIFAAGTDGTIVIVGEVSIDTAEWLNNNGFSYMYTGWKNDVTVTLTSNYGGTDYRTTNNAKLILDRTKCAAVNILVGCKSAMKDLDIEYRYNDNVKASSSFESEFMFLEYAGSFVVDTGVNVVSKNYTDPDNIVEGDRYPTVLGGRRAGGDNWIGDKTIVLKSGTWGNVIGGQHGYGTEKAEVKSVSITIDGAKVANVYGVSSPKTTSAVVLNNASISILSGEVGVVYGNNGAGIKGALNINVAEAAKVGEVNYVLGTPANTPTSTTLTYHRTALDDANVKGFTGSNVTVVPVGLPEGQKVIYVSNTGAGTKDGSSPANAMGHDDGYANTLANGTADEKKALVKKNVLYKALSDATLLEKGGYVVFVGETTVDVSASMYFDSMTEFTWVLGDGQTSAHGKKNITFTSIDPLNDNKDYRTEGAKFVLDVTRTNICLDIRAPQTWENVNIEYVYNSSTVKDYSRGGFISASGEKMVFGSGITTTATDKNTTKVTLYPSIIGGHRWMNLTANPDITVKSGTWGCVLGQSFGTTSIGKVTGNITINFEGGKATNVSAGNRIVNWLDNTPINGNVVINVNGGEITNLYGSGSAGVADGKTITVNVAEASKVGKAWGYMYISDSVNGTKAPANATINFNADALAEANVKYFTTVNKTGGGTVTPPPPPSTEPAVIYVAQTSKGTGDGSSPENAMGNDSDYAAIYAEILTYPTTNRTEDQTNTIKNLLKKNALYKALSNANLQANGGTIVIVGETVLDVTESFYFSSLTEAYLPKFDKEVKITSIDPKTNKDYRTEGAKLVFDSTNTLMNVGFHCPTVWENLNIENKFNSAKYNGILNANRYLMLTFQGYKTVFGEGLKVVSNDIAAAPIEAYPTIVGGSRWNNTENGNRNSDITIKSGTWGSVFGANYGVGSNGKTSMKTNITVEGGKIVDVLTGTTKNIDKSNTTVVCSGDVTITVNGGEVAKIIGVNQNGFGLDTNKLVVTIGENAKVGSAWAYDATGTNDDKRPANSTCNFAYKAIREEEVKYFTNTNPSGDPSDQPALKENVYYIANVATGDGSGKDADNLMGHAADYYTALQSSDPAVKNAAYKKNVLYRVLNETSLLTEGGKVVIAGVTTVDSSDKMLLTDLAEFHWPKESDKTVTFTSVYGGTDYRTSGAKFVLDRRNTTILIEMKSPTVWENITIEQIFNNKDGVDAQRAAGFAGNGNKTVFGEGIKCISTDVNASPVECYPTIIGGHRWENLKKNNDITIKSGTWGCVLGANWGTTATGSHTGNVTITVDGGTIEYLTASNKNTETTSNAVINGNVKITVNGGRIDKMTVTNHNGLGDDKYSIEVTIGENASVGKAWAFNHLGSNAAKQPKNSTITYASCAIREDQVKYFTNATMVGDPSLQPELEVYTIYIANEAKGNGDGSSPENAMGHDAGYYNELAQAIEISKIKVAERTTEQNDFVKNLTKKNVMYKAMSDKKLLSGGGKVVLVGPVTLDVTSSMRQDNMCEFDWGGKGDEVITFTSVDKGVDYRQTNGAKLTFDVRYTCVNFNMNGPTLWENITIEHLYNSKTCSDAERAAMFSGNCFKTVFGEGIECTAIDTDARNIKLYPTIIGGHRWSNLKRDSDITIKSGKWGSVFCANFGTATVGHFTANTNITVEGGEITLLSGGNKNTNTSATTILTGNVNITINGGIVRKILGTHHNGLAGEGNRVNVTIGSGARVGKAWGFQYTVSGADKQPTAYITYASNAIRSEDVKYFTNATMVGDPSLAPEEMLYTLYIANKAKGTGDGSSPENAMGHDPDYASALKTAKKYAGYKNPTQEQKDFISNVYKKNVFYKVMQDPTLMALGGKIVLVGPVTVDVGGSINKSLNDFTLPGACDERITITSKDNGVDYRRKGAKLTFDTTAPSFMVFTMNAPSLWEYITIEHRYNSDNGAHIEATAMIACNGYETEFGYGIYTYNTDIGKNTKENYISILGGHRWKNLTTGSKVTIRSGTWGYVLGGNFGTTTMGKFKGNVDILVTGGKISRIIGTNKTHTTSHKETVEGNVRIRIWGGEVDIIYGTNNNGIKKGYVSVSIGKGAKVNQAYGYHPNYKGKAKVYAYLWYHPDSIPKNKIYNFIQATPQTSSAIVFFIGAAAVAGAGAVVAGKKSKKRKIR